MINSFNELKRKVCKSINQDEIIESEMKMVEQMKATQKEHHRKIVKMVFTAMPLFLRDAFSII